MPRARNKLYHSSEAAKPAQSVPGSRNRKRGQSADISYNLVHIAPLLRYIGETKKS